MKSLLVLFFALISFSNSYAIYISPEIYETDMYDIKNFLTIASDAPIFAYMSCAIDRTRRLEFIIEKNPEFSDRADVILQKKFWNGTPTGDRSYIVLNAKLSEGRRTFALLIDMDNKSEGQAFIQIKEVASGLYASYKGTIDINLKATPDINTSQSIYNADCELLR